MSYKRANDFLDNWGYISDVLQSIPDAVFYKVVKTDEVYKSGKPVYKCYFLNVKLPIWRFIEAPVFYHFKESKCNILVK